MSKIQLSSHSAAAQAAWSPRRVETESGECKVCRVHVTPACSEFFRGRAGGWPRQHGQRRLLQVCSLSHSTYDHRRLDILIRNLQKSKKQNGTCLSSSPASSEVSPPACVRPSGSSLLVCHTSCLSQLPVCRNFLFVATSCVSQLLIEGTRAPSQPSPAWLWRSAPFSKHLSLRSTCAESDPSTPWLPCSLFNCANPKRQHGALMLDRCRTDPPATKVFKVFKVIEKH